MGLATATGTERSRTAKSKTLLQGREEPAKIRVEHSVAGQNLQER